MTLSTKDLDEFINALKELAPGELPALASTCKTVLTVLKLIRLGYDLSVDTGNKAFDNLLLQVQVIVDTLVAGATAEDGGSK